MAFLGAWLARPLRTLRSDRASTSDLGSDQLTAINGGTPVPTVAPGPPVGSAAFPPPDSPLEPHVSQSCSHLDQAGDVTPSSDGCEDCLRIGGQWVHLRMCMACGHVGCCDNSPNRHATAHWQTHPDHPLIRSYEPGEDWWWCYPDDLFFELDGAPPAPSHP